MGITTLLILGACANGQAPTNAAGTPLPQTSGAYKFTVGLNNGSYQSYTQTTSADIRVGDRVQIDNSALRRY